MNRANLVKNLPLAIILMMLLLLASGSKPAQATAQPTAALPSTLALSRIDAAAAPNIPPARGGYAGDVQAAGTTVTVTTQITGSADAEIIQGYPTANCGDKDAWLVRAGYDIWMTPNGQILRSLIHFNLADIPPDAVIHNATLKLYVAGSYDSQSMLATPYRILSPWYENAVTWNSQPSWAESYGTASIPHAFGWVSFDVTALVQGWANGSYPNYGLMVRGHETSAGWRAFGARNAAIDPGPTWIPPHLDLTYSFEQDFRMFLVANRHTLEPGDSAASILYLDPIGWFDQPVVLSVSGLPAHTSYALGQTTIAPTGTTSLHITTTALTPPGTYTITVAGTSPDKVNTVQGVLSVIVPDFELSISPAARTIGAGDQTTLTVDLVSLWGFADPVTLELGGLPAHTSYAWSQNPTTPTGSVLLTITADTDVLPGSYLCTVTGTAGSLVHSAPFTLTVSEPTFELLLASVDQSVAPGDSAQFAVSVARIGPFAAGVSLSVGGLPAHATHGWSQNPVTPPGSSILTIDTTPATPVGEYTLIITGSGGGKTSVVSATLKVSEHTVYLPLVLKNHVQPAGGQVQGNGTVDRIALLVGVATYQETGDITAGDNRTRKDVNLLFSNADPQAILGEIIRELIGAQDNNFAPENAIMLLDSQATKGAIHDAIVNRIAPLVGQDTLVLIFFSGHGLHTTDDDGDEDDPYDEFIVPYGINVNDGGPLSKIIRDDELASWLGELKSNHVVVVIDTCFSGGMVTSAGADSRVKSLSAYFSPQASLSAQDWQDGFAQDVQGSGRIILMASGENESSIESSELGQGVFTYYFAEALRTASADTSGNGWVSVEEAFTYLQPRVRAYTSNVQNPQISDGIPGEVNLTVPLTTVTTCPNW